MRNQFVTTGPQNLGLGHGQYACSGRFLASNEIKVVLTGSLRRRKVEGDLQARSAGQALFEANGFGLEFGEEP